MQQKVQNRHQEWIRRKELGVLYPLYQDMTLGSVPFHYPDSSEYNQCLFDFTVQNIFCSLSMNDDRECICTDALILW